jgi:hypothetical protein
MEDPGQITVRQVGRFVGEDVRRRIVRVVEDGRLRSVIKPRRRALESVSWHRGRW